MKETEFLQSEEWLKFQEATGKETVRLSSDGFSANGILYMLPMVGKYLYVPRGPIAGIKYQVSGIGYGMERLIEESKKRRANWIRIEPETEEMLEEIKKELETLRPLRQAQGRPEEFEGRQAQGDNLSVVKAPHDMQPRETFVMDITPGLETLLAQMKPKTRYNIGLAEKRGVKVFATREEKYKQAFLDLITATANRKEITPHPRAYYEKFFTDLPEETCQLFVAEYDGKVLAANLLITYGTRATYLHGGSGNEYRDVMAPYLLQWKQIQYAKERGCTEYDFGGIKTVNNQQSTDNGKQKTRGKNSWEGITRFKTGFAPGTQPTVFPGTYDIVLNQSKYALYNRLRLFKENFLLMKKFFKV
ncbi:MAG: peptidoglycan bridge formation glycyltransferase FemA/FemB family protein [Candidatus Moranbacteria bacterium]|nr:peptidoglycan bridge formation glycyltransferase FemA/FemB family protein [Candidatus Moranbacteria bacterium]